MIEENYTVKMGTIIKLEVYLGEEIHKVYYTDGYYA